MIKLWSKTESITNSIKPLVLVSLDGWGIASPSEGNAITLAKTPHFDSYMNLYPHGELIASGESVGLPANEEGNSEVGHLTMGTGRPILQSLKRINASIKDGTFYENRAFLRSIDHIKKYSSVLHIMGLVGSGDVHSSTEHLFALIDFCRRMSLTNVKFHLFTDGRDAPPRDGINVVDEIDKKLKNYQVGSIASIMGRYYAMDRDFRWDRTEIAYNALTLAEGTKANSAVEAIKSSYEKNETDEFIKPILLIQSDGVVSTIRDNDAVLFFNFRIDRPRQLTMAFVAPDFEKLKTIELEETPDHLGRGKEKDIIKIKTFVRKKIVKNLYFVTFTQYQRSIPVSDIAFPPQEVTNSVAEILSKYNITQFRLAESEKERMVTYYFDGLKDDRLPGEDVIIIPSKKVATYDLKPEMSAYEIAKTFKKIIARNKYKFIMMNFANPDMVAHTGDLDRTIEAIEHVDKTLDEVVESTLLYSGTVIITADHGNAEELITYPSHLYFYTTQKGEKDTEHSNNPVPVIIINKLLKGENVTLPNGSLSDIAPTILNILKLPVPEIMEGNNLLANLNF